MKQPERIDGNGKLNFVLIHNAGGSHHFFSHQIELLKQFGNIVCLDLPGHNGGEGIASYKMADLSSSINKTCRELSLDNICLIGLNNGADIVIDTVLNHELPIKHIILIDPPIFMDDKFITEIEEFISALDTTNYGEFVDELVNALFIDTNQLTKKIAADAFNQVERKALQEMFKGLIEWDTQSEGKLGSISCPVLCIITDEHHCSYQKLRQEAPQFEIGKVIGSKCWATLEVPEQVNAMIARFLQLHKG
ncbi:2-succinyl-6-hydroxy-2,4-cyclohexadiene-1-carboxylate synthase [Legionella quinlivanii]|uniref:2-succinyl-6-hydroxy-2, 4-cyclohexadiene-1-carboxylate synthase n=2 Tax=Legionella quinlivanii TaxID=45073 RepID=A0A0W0Y5A7_9GAMM|nr:2-succinyl-6-hydroxy-2,4-cyclohexadiene-1-carboxylate synthase [Legionella quinlivanii]SEF76722.1 Pimeloyl-ACP methyl ester carboxylesterase [Legionella quinlivanii DSM 21216]STY12329.1 acetoin dehydrogenase E2 subunit dihydrolipoyllysine-residue acetyltransferase [Legionella quinlivanii]